MDNVLRALMDAPANLLLLLVFLYYYYHYYFALSLVEFLFLFQMQLLSRECGTLLVTENYRDRNTSRALYLHSDDPKLIPSDLDTWRPRLGIRFVVVRSFPYLSLHLHLHLLRYLY